MHPAKAKKACVKASKSEIDPLGLLVLDINLSCSVAPIIFPFSFGGCPTNMVFPKKGANFPGSLNN